MASSPDPSEDELLDQEIAALEQQAASLRKTLQIETSTILAAPSTQPLLVAAPRPAGGSDQLLSQAELQRAHVQQSLHRIGASVTAFRVRDPDPRAVDAGRVLGLRFEALSRGAFLRPYYVLLNRPYTAAASPEAPSPALRVHRHTLPPAVPLAALAARHLPAPHPGRQSAGQDLDRFVRAVRREVARYHNRLGVSADLRRALGLHEARRPAAAQPNAVVDVAIADVEAKQIRLAWADERSGRVVMDDDGRLVKLVVLGRHGRDWAATKELHGRYERIEDVTKRLEEYAREGSMVAEA